MIRGASDRCEARYGKGSRILRSEKLPAFAVSCRPSTVFQLAKRLKEAPTRSQKSRGQSSSQASTTGVFQRTSHSCNPCSGLIGIGIACRHDAEPVVHVPNILEHALRGSGVPPRHPKKTVIKIPMVSNRCRTQHFRVKHWQTWLASSLHIVQSRCISKDLAVSLRAHDQMSTGLSTPLSTLFRIQLRNQRG